MATFPTSGPASARWRRRPSLAVLAVAAGLAAATPARAGGSVTVEGSTPGPTPFIAYVDVALHGAALTSAAFAVQPEPGSFTRPIVATASARFLASHGVLSGSNAIIPVFGLYAGRTNAVTLYFAFADGSGAQAEVPITAAAYTDPCGSENQRRIAQNRTATSDLSFDYFILKDYCSGNSPAILDTDGNVRWVGFANVGSLPGEFYENGIYTSDGATGVNRLDLYGLVTKIGDYAASEAVTSTNNHNIDLGRQGLIVDVSTKTEKEAAALEIDGTTGQVLNVWDMGRIVAAAMRAGGDDPSGFVYPDGTTDWFHMNSSAYNPADNTLIVSSRENFVMAVDYDVPADGVRKIHWILGDDTKKWYQYASLRRYALTLSPGTLAPIGQHAVSIDSHGNLLLFDDGYGSQFQQPPGETRGYSVVNSYAIDTAAMTATAVYGYDPNPSIYSYICGSAYEAASDNHLVDFATAANDTVTDIRGLGANNTLVFDLQIPATNYCGAGWNASPLPSVPIDYE